MYLFIIIIIFFFCCSKNAKMLKKRECNVPHRVSTTQPFTNNNRTIQNHKKIPPSPTFSSSTPYQKYFISSTFKEIAQK